MLLISLGVVSLGLTSCGETSSEPSSEPSTPATESSTPVEESTPSVEESTPSVEVSSPDESSPVVEIPEEVVFDVDFNYGDSKNSLTVWTDFAVNGTIAPINDNVSENPETAGIRRTVPIGTNTDISNGYYFFAVDENGYIIYASFGLGYGFGTPCDIHYNNLEDPEDMWSAPYFSLHNEYGPWPEKTSDGRNAWTLFDFIIPEGGFVVKGHVSEPEFASFWTEITGTDKAPNGGYDSNDYLGKEVEKGSLNKFYVSINSERQLTVRERMEGELVNDRGKQEIDTPAVNFEFDEAVDGLPVYTSVKEISDLDLTNGVAVENVKGVITLVRGNNIIIEDAAGDAVLIYDKAGAMAEYVVGDTVVVSGTAVLYGGYPELKDLSSVTKVEGYGSLTAGTRFDITEENVAAEWDGKNIYQLVNIVKAQVTNIDGDYTTLTLGETEITLYKAPLGENVVVGDYIDVSCSIEAYNGNLQGRVASAEDIVKYYGVTVDVDGVDGVAEPVTYLAALGDTVTLEAKHDDESYQFIRWERLTVAEDGTEVWVEDSTESTKKVTITETRETYRAVFEFGPWANLGDTYVEQMTLTGYVQNAGDSAFSIFTDNEAFRAVVTESGDNEWVANGWRTVLIVDKDNKVALFSYNAAYCGMAPNSEWYGRHSSYADPTTNPALSITEGGWDLVIPEGGFAISMHTNNINEIFAALGLEVGYVKNEHNLDTARIFFDSSSERVLVYRDEVDSSATANGVINSVNAGLPTVYNDKAENVTLGDFTVAVDANGKVIFASKTASGYGGPGDGFYHDGNYTVVAGQKCGIFVLDPEWAPWDNKTEDGRDAWTLYSVVAPEGGYIVTGTWDQMASLMKAIDASAVADGNYFEGVADTLFNETVTVEVVENSKVANIDVVIAEKEVKEGLVWSGATVGSFTLNAETGLYEATIELAKWNRVIFTYTDAEGNETILNYETATLAGLFTAADVNGADWTKNLYHEIGADGVDSATIGEFLTCTGGTYILTYDVETKTLTATEPVFEEVEVTVDASGATMFTGAEGETPALADVTIALDADGKIIFASYTAPGYGGPGDGFYHDGSYQKVPGEAHGIFSLDPEWAPWDNKTEDGRDAWTLYTVVVPEGACIITGTVEQMLPIVNAIFEKELTEMKNNAFFESQIADGDFNHVTVKLEAAEETPAE